MCVFQNNSVAGLLCVLCVCVCVCVKGTEVLKRIPQRAKRAIEKLQRVMNKI